jgi:hypothetical protein
MKVSNSTKTTWVSPFAHMSSVKKQNRDGLKAKETLNMGKAYDNSSHWHNFRKHKLGHQEMYRPRCANTAVGSAR